ncbi:MAG: DUF3619 family protein [Betaproteobacteria bacterium]
MNESHFGSEVRHLLNQRLEPGRGVAGRLRAAREAALARQRPEPAPALAWADNVLGRLGGWSGVSLRIIAPLVALAISVGAVYSWQMKQRLAEVEEIDAQLLTDDLPIDAYLDRNFQNWLKKRALEQ